MKPTLTQTELETEELKRFREDWQAEVKKKKHGKDHARNSSTESAPDKQESSSSSILPSIPQFQPIGLTQLQAETASATVSPPSIHLAASTSISGSSSAVAIYRQAVLHEQKGDLDEALRLYRQAFRRDPDVDRKYHQEERLGAFLSQPANIQDLGADRVDRALESLTESVKHTLAFQDNKATEKETQIADGPGTSRLSSVLNEFPQQLVFEPEDEQEPVLLNMLPDEMIVDIIKRLDTSSIERFATVNRKARIISLDGTIWRELVDATYKPPQIPQEEVLQALYDQYLYDYRKLYIEHPRVRMDGVYIAVCHYIRPGLSDNSWVNMTHLITYHRYLRFFPNGVVLSLLTNEEQTPAAVVPRLKLTTKPMKGLFIGTWSLSETTILLSNLVDSVHLPFASLADFTSTTILTVIDKMNGNATHPNASHSHVSSSTSHSHSTTNTQPAVRYIFTMSLALRSRPLGRWNKLDIASYDSVNLETGDAHPVALKHERPFWFSKVRSYAA